VLAALRGSSRPRRVIDPGLAGGLKAWLEDGLGPMVHDRAGSDPPAVITKAILTEAGPEARSGGAELSTNLVRGVLVDALFRQLVTIGRIGDPLADALAAVAADDGQRAVLDYVRSLPEPAAAQLAEDVRAQAGGLRTWWPPLAPSWLPRTADRVSLPVAGGRVLLAGVFDLVIGRPCAGVASVCLVELKSGAPRLTDRDELWFYALLETLRSGAPPFRAATCYSRTGGIDAFDVSDEGLAATVNRIIEAAGRRLAPGVGNRPC
jgi:hypothetical protein